MRRSSRGSATKSPAVYDENAGGNVSSLFSPQGKADARQSSSKKKATPIVSLNETANMSDLLSELRDSSYIDVSPTTSAIFTSAKKAASTVKSTKKDVSNNKSTAKKNPRRETLENCPDLLNSLLDNSDMFHEDENVHNNRRETIDPNGIDLDGLLDESSQSASVFSTNSSLIKSTEKSGRKSISNKNQTPEQELLLFSQEKSGKKSGSKRKSIGRPSMSLTEPIAMSDFLDISDTSLPQIKSVGNDRRETFDANALQILLDDSQVTAGDQSSVRLSLEKPLNQSNISTLSNDDTKGSNGTAVGNLLDLSSMMQDNTNTRRQTIDAHDINDLLNDLDDNTTGPFSANAEPIAFTSALNGFNNSVSMSNLTEEVSMTGKLDISDDRRKTIDQSDIIKLMAEDSISQTSYIMQEEEENEDDDRRKTIDQSDLIKLMAEDSVEKSDFVEEEDDDRRKTIDQRDIMKMMADDSIVDNDPSQMSIQSNKDNSTNTINTAELIGNVSKMLHEQPAREASPFQEEEEISAPENDVSALSDISFASSVRIPSIQDRNQRRETVDSVDVAWLLEEIGANDDTGDDDSVASSRSRDSARDSIATIDLLNAVADTLEEDRPLRKKSPGKKKKGSKRKSLRDSVSGKKVKPSEENDESMMTIGTIDLIESVQHALDDDQQESDNESIGSLAPLEDLLKRAEFSVMEVDAAATSSLKRKPVTPVSVEKQVTRPRILSPVASQLGKSMVVSSALKSCLSSKKTVPQNKSVIFGSPDVAEFNKLSPTTKFTPMDKRTAKQLFQLPLEMPLAATAEEEVDEVTAENERILEDWDRLTNVSETGSDEDNDTSSQFFDEEATSFTSPQSTTSSRQSIGSNRSSNKKNRRRLSKLQPVLDFADEPQMMSLQTSMDQDDVTHTVQLPSNLADLIAENNVAGDIHDSFVMHQSTSMIDQSMQSNQSKTVEIETDLRALMTNIEGKHSFVQEDAFREQNTSGFSDSSDAYNPLRSSFVPQLDQSSNFSSDSSNHQMSILTNNYLENSVLSHASETSGNSVLQGLIADRPMMTNGPFSVHVDADQSQMSQMSQEQEVSNYEQESVMEEVSNHSSQQLQYSAELSSMEKSVERSAMEEDLKYLVPSRDASLYAAEESDLPANSEAEVSAIASSEASTIPDDSMQQEQFNLSFVDTKRRMLMAATSMLDSPVMSSQDLNKSDIASSQVLAKTSDLMNRLKALNAGARSNALAQCSTPGVPSKASLEMRRKSFRNNLEASGRKSIIPSMPMSQKKEVSIVHIGANDMHVSRAEDVMDTYIPVANSQTPLMNKTKSVTSTPASIKVPTPASTKVPTPKSSAKKDLSIEDIQIPEIPDEAEVERYFKEDSERFFNVMQSIKFIVSTQIPHVIELSKSLVLDTFHSASFGTTLADISREFLVQAWDYEMDTFDAFYDFLSQQVDFQRMDISIHMMAMNNWDQVWVDLTTSALSELCESLKTMEFSSSSSQDKIMQKLIGHSVNSNTSADHIVPTISRCVHDIQNQQEAFSQQQASLHEAEMLYRITNRITYYRVVSLLANHLELDIHLSDSAKVVMKFDMQANATAGYQITNTDVEMSFASPSTEDPINAVWVASEHAFIAAFFAGVLANEEQHGPLSEKWLSNVTHLADVPGTLEKVR